MLVLAGPMPAGALPPPEGEQAGNGLPVPHGRESTLFAMPDGATFVPGEVIVVWQDGAQSQPGASGAQGYAALSSDAVAVVKVPQGGEEQAINDYMAQPGVMFAQPNYCYETLGDGGGGVTFDASALETPQPSVPNDPYYVYQQRYMRLVEMDLAWSVTAGSPAVKIGIVDTGINPGHEDMRRGDESQFTGQASTIGGKLEYGDSAVADTSLNGHGTHVAGIIGAVAGNGIGIAGVAPDCLIVPIRAGDGNSASESSFTTTTVSMAIDYAISQGVRVINLSLGGESFDWLMQDACERAEAAGVTVVAAAGNNKLDSGNQSSYLYPASFPTVLSVSGVNADGNSSGYTANDSVDISAPATGIYSTGTRANSYTILEGTSMAAAFVTGACALLLSVNPELTPRDLRYLLRASAQDRGDEGYDAVYGYGILDAWAALDALDTLASAGAGIVPGDELEPNDTVGLATPLTLLAAEGPGCSVAAEASSTLDSIDDVDVFRVTFSESGSVEFEVDAPPGLALAQPLFLEAYDAPVYFWLRRMLPSSFTQPVEPGGTYAAQFDIEAGDYYVFIEAYARGTFSDEPYNLRINAQLDCPPTPTPTPKLSTSPPYQPPVQSGGSSSPSSPSASLAPTPSPTASPTPTPTQAPAPTATPAPMPMPTIIPLAVRTFTDVPGTQWAAVYIQELASRGIIDGYLQQDGTYVFMPDAQITRAELVKLIVASLGLPLEYGFGGAGFSDWGDVDAWAVPYISAAILAGIMKGSSEDGGLYVNAASPVTRQEMVAMVVRSIVGDEGMAAAQPSTGDGDDIAASLPAADAENGGPSGALAGGPPSVADAADIEDIMSADEWARDTLAFALRLGLIDVSPATYAAGGSTAETQRAYLARPLVGATRAEVAHTLCKLLVLLGI